MRLEYKCEFNCGNSLKMPKYSVNNSTFDIFKCALRDCSCFFVTPWRFPLTPTSMDLRRIKALGFKLHNGINKFVFLPFALIYFAVNDRVR